MDVFSLTTPILWNVFEYASSCFICLWLAKRSTMAMRFNTGFCVSRSVDGLIVEEGVANNRAMYSSEDKSLPLEQVLMRIQKINVRQESLMSHSYLWLLKIYLIPSLTLGPCILEAQHSLEWEKIGTSQTRGQDPSHMFGSPSTIWLTKHPMSLVKLPCTLLYI